MSSVATLRPSQGASSAPTDQDVHAALVLGVRNRWHPILPSNEVATGGKPLGIRRLGEALVLWRDQTGRNPRSGGSLPAPGGAAVARHQRGRPPALQLSRCRGRAGRHRACRAGPAWLSAGRDEGRQDIPGAGDRRCHLRMVRRRLASGARSLHAAAAACGRGIQQFSLLRRMGDVLAVPLRQQHGPDARGPFCTPTRTRCTRATARRCSRPATRRRVSSSRRPGSATSISTGASWSTTTRCYVRLEIPYPPSAGPGGNFGIISFGTPIDENNTACFFWRVRKVSGWERNTWRFLYKTRIEARHWAVLEQDRAMLSGCRPGLEKFETLYQHDAGVVRLRRHLANTVRSQLQELAESGNA